MKEIQPRFYRPLAHQKEDVKMKKFAALFAMVLLAACGGEQNPVVVEQSVPAEYFKAICYHPVNVGNTQRSWEYIDQDLDLMQEAGISVIRVYMPITDENVLDKLAERGMKVITSFGYNQDSVYDLYSGTYLDSVSYTHLTLPTTPYV